MQFVFEDHVLDIDRRELLRGGVHIAVQPQVFDLLTHLIENRDRVVTKEDLISLVWAGRTVSDSTLTSRINAARTAVGDSGKAQRLIRTVARKGFRFIGEVRKQPVSASAADASPQRGHSAQREMAVPDRPAIAVLAFENMSEDPEQEYFCDGISEDILTALSKVKWFFVIARNSSFSYKGRAVHINQIAEELSVRYVLEGSVRKDSGRVRITAQLNDVATGSHVWAERYDRDLTDVFAVQDEITTAIVAAIEPQIYAAENFRARRKPPHNLDAWDLVMRALSHYWRVTRHDQSIAQALLEQAIAIDPNYGQALSVLATSHMRGVHLGWTDLATVAPVAERAALKAVEVAGDDAWARTALGSVYFSTRRLADAISEFELALQLNPNFSMAHGYYALALCYCGRPGHAYEAAQRAIRHSPRDPSLAIYHGIAAYARFVENRYDEAIALAREAVRQRGDLTGAYRVLTVAAGMAGDLDAARAALQELRRSQPNISLAWIANELPWKFDADRQHYLEGFRRAGLT
ncbi:winged helix-turn-helix domain-containing tetratricopeptide repeat protein [Bradyrhizobium sp. STM 3562]|uniref:winged helix-turn-helix domain-containing tetratricopeptide repeat protein n=1 Tax=Bradyrhizobium sp. STM 3562 TaxID=578924 RepID=UPI0038909613